ncbi:NTF2 domain-containing protein [Rhizobium phaseoli]|nr:NTF2 domain-containing protein [Rhizobium phaseoli]
MGGGPMKMIIASPVAFMMMVAPSIAKADSMKPEDRLAIIDAITDIAAGADRHQWPRVRGAFAEKVTLDYTSLWGGEAVTLSADEVVAQWSNFLPGFDRTLHLVTNHAIVDASGDTATAEADFQATHSLGKDLWVLSGHYRYGLVKSAEGWKITHMTMAATHETGDRDLVGKAAERAAKKMD